MNEPQHDWLEETPVSDALWLDMLIDGELTTQQRATFVSHIQETGDWQRVATGFLNNQVLESTVGFGEETQQVEARMSRPRGKRTWMTFAAMVAAAMGGLLVGWMLPPSNSGQDVAQKPEQVDPQPTAASEMATASTPSHTTLPGLFQVQDTPTEAVYYADFSIPQFLLDALVIAGHSVTFDQEFLGYTESPDSRAAVPINVVRIQKYGRLLATASADMPQNQ